MKTALAFAWSLHICVTGRGGYSAFIPTHSAEGLLWRQDCIPYRVLFSELRHKMSIRSLLLFLLRGKTTSDVRPQKTSLLGVPVWWTALSAECKVLASLVKRCRRGTSPPFVLLAAAFAARLLM